MIDPGTRLVARYELVSTLPDDLADAEAWAAHDLVLGRAVRVLLPRGDRVPQVLDAARRAALVADPRLVRVLDVGVDHLPGPDGTEQPVPYVVTEPFAGTTLTDLTAGGPLDADLARSVVGEAAGALESARRRGLHHWALRPDAVRVRDDGRVLVTGLGVDGPLAGLDEADADPDAASRADAVGLVALLYHALSGRWPTAALEGEWLDPDSPRPVPAPRTGAGPVALRTLAPQAPGDLQTLTGTTLDDTRADGPATPGEVAAALQPWGPVTLPAPPVAAVPADADPAERGPGAAAEADDAGSGAVARAGAAPGSGTAGSGTAGSGAVAASGVAGAGVAGAGVAGAGVAGAGAAAGPSSAAPVGAGTPQRLSVRTAATGAGSPPPVSPAAASTVHPTAAATSGTPLSGPALSPVRSASGRGAASARAQGHRFDPTRITLAVFAVAVLVAAVIAGTTVLDGLRPAVVYQGQSTTQPDDQPKPAPTASGDETAEPSPEPKPDPPVIASGAQIDPPPDGDNNEHPEAVDRAFDGDLNTYWYTRTYRTPQFSNLKKGVGYEITLEKAAEVSRIVLDTNSTGGNVEVRATDAANPTQGPVLASGPFADETVLKLSEPVTSTTFVLWITELPQTDGENRLELNEIQLS